MNETLITKTLHPYISKVYTVDPNACIAVDQMSKILDDWHPVNRPEEKLKTEKYYRTIIQQSWAMLGDPVRFDWNGNLIDGRHRFKAHIKANVPFNGIVVYGINPKNIEVIDESSRDQRTRFILTNVIRDEANQPPVKITTQQKTKMGAELAICKMWMRKITPNFKPNDNELEMFKSEHQSIINNVLDNTNVKDKRTTNRTGFKVASAIYFSKCPMEAKTFYDLCGSDNLDVATPIGYLKNYFSKENPSGGGKGQLLDYAVTVAMIHAFHNKEDVKLRTGRKDWITKQEWEF